jgi:hypothetical protein
VQAGHPAWSLTLLTAVLTFSGPWIRRDSKESIKFQYMVGGIVITQ